MIVLPRQRLVIFTPPKCGSHSLHARLCQADIGGITVIGHDPDLGDVGRHYCRSSHEWETFDHHAVVRNPFSRVVSLYHDYCRIRAYWGQSGPAFSEFVDSLPKLETRTPGEWFWNSRLVDCLQHVPNSTRFHKLESLGSLLSPVGLSDLPRDNASLTLPWLDYYTPPTAARVRELYAADFERFGYCMEPPRA